MVVSKKKKPLVSKKGVKKILKKKKAVPKRIRVSKISKRRKSKTPELKRSLHNPVMSPRPDSYWESEAVFNPGAVVSGDRVHLFYRALGADGVSRVGYASSKDGIHFDRRHPHPVYMPETVGESAKHHPYTSPARLAYDTELYVSGGGWGGCEDPRAVKIDGRIYLTFNMFNGWGSIRVGVTSISEDDLEEGRWNWRRMLFLSPPNQIHKNWMLFPEKMDNKFAILHSVSPDVKVDYVEELEDLHIGRRIIQSSRSEDKTYPHYTWESWIRGTGAPPIKTKYGWLAFYHAMDKKDPNRYKLGVLLLDLNDPTKILYRSSYPILEPDEWYENDWKPGIIYASGAIVKGDTLFIYYGGGDKHIGVAYAKLEDFIKKLMKNEHIVLSTKSSKVE